jgi:ubiquinone/menaquinone biosynthesis C-methylase UbiE
MPAHKDSVYIMGTTDDEYERLRRQARMFERFAVAAFDRIQLGQGMSCLDVGCGPGEVMRLMAERVGSSGRVVGIDVDDRIAAQALNDLRSKGYAQCSIVTADLYTLEQTLHDVFDVVYARLLVQHLDDPLAGLTQMYRRVKPGGQLVIQDMYLPAIDSDSPTILLREMRSIVDGVWGKAGKDARVGVNLPGHFIRAGIGVPDGTDAATDLVPMRDAVGMITSVYKSVLPLALKLGVTTEERSKQFFAEAADATRDETSYTLMPLIISVWKKKPAGAA